MLTLNRAADELNRVTNPGVNVKQSNRQIIGSSILIRKEEPPIRHAAEVDPDGLMPCMTGLPRCSTPTG